LNELGKLLYGYESYKKNLDEKLASLPAKIKEDVQSGMEKLLTPRHVQFFKRYGYVVVENVISQELIQKCKHRTTKFLRIR